ncbi:MAG: TrmH family RNA methyltransferase [Candidatus Sungbacteria bacterium]|nr:TrmH family RNA methyltransferase [Candidatus Sungbacteria bacterium]
MIAILYNIRSIHNVGSIFRTANGAGIEKIYLCGITPSPVDSLGKPVEKFTKVSLGAEQTLLWEKVRSCAGLLARLKKEGYRIYALEQDRNSMPYYTVHFTDEEWEKTALVAGHERTGISRALLKRADKILEIPMHGSKESLNVAVAFGIAAYHLRHTE